MYLVPYNATNVRVRHAYYPAVFVPAYRHPSVMPVTCVAPLPHCRGSGADGDQDDVHASVDEYDGWRERMEAGEFDPKPGTPGYPARYAGAFLLRSDDGTQLLCFCIKELYENKMCLVKSFFDKGTDWKDMSRFELVIEYFKNGQICLIFQVLDGDFEEIIEVSNEMKQSFCHWITSNGFRISNKSHADKNVSEFKCELPRTFAGEDQQHEYNAWLEKMQAVTYELPDEYDLWCEKIKAGELDPKPNSRGYPARCVGAFVLKSTDNAERFCFCITEKYGQRKCFALRYDNTWIKMNTPNFEIYTCKNGQKELDFDHLGGITVTEEMMKYFREWMHLNNFRCILHKVYNGEDQDGSEELKYQLDDTMPGTDLYDVWKAKVTHGFYSRGGHLTHPFLLRSTDGKKIWPFCMYRAAESISSICVWTANPNIFKQDTQTRQWNKNSKLDVLFEKDPDDDNAWELYILSEPHAAFMRIDEQMKRGFEAWLAECAIFKTPKTDPVYYNARGYSYAF